MSPLPAGWMREASTSRAPVTPRALAARDAVFAALPSTCPDEVADLWRRCHAGSALDAEVLAWTTEHRLAAPWLVARLVDGLAHGATVDDLRDPTLFWDRDDFECATRAAPALALAEGVSLAAHDLTRDWSVLHEIAADPLNETLDQFLERARAHYRARVVVVDGADLERGPRTREHARDGRWLLLHRAKRHSYAEIARADLPGHHDGAERVRTAVRRLAIAAGLRSGPPRT